MCWRVWRGRRQRLLLSSHAFGYVHGDICIRGSYAIGVGAAGQLEDVAAAAVVRVQRQNWLKFCLANWHGWYFPSKMATQFVWALLILIPEKSGLILFRITWSITPTSDCY